MAYWIWLQERSGYQWVIFLMNQDSRTRAAGNCWIGGSIWLTPPLALETPAPRCAYLFGINQQFRTSAPPPTSSILGQRTGRLQLNCTAERLQLGLLLFHTVSPSGILSGAVSGHGQTRFQIPFNRHRT